MDDGSVDGTKKVAFDFVKKYKVENVRVLLLGRNYGKGEAIRKVSKFKLVSNFFLGSISRCFPRMCVVCIPML